MKTGIMGGTFDPIHMGHLFLAQEVMHTYALDRIIFVPSKKGPHKLDRQATDAGMRVDMVKLAIASYPSFELSTIEVERQGLSYTIDTLNDLKATYPYDDFYFITGADALVTLESWKDFKDLLKATAFVAATRPSVMNQDLKAKVNDLTTAYGSVIHVMPMLGLEISSSDIRTRIKQGRPIRYLVPDAVHDYIESRGLYVGS